MPLDYRQVKDIYDNLHDAGVVSTPLPEWSDRMNQLTGSDLYSAGLHDNIIKRSSVAIDRLLEKTIPGTTTSLPELGESFGRGVGGLVGAPDTGASIGHSLPRMTANFLPLLAGAVATGGAAVPAEIGGLIGAGALSGAQTYTDTGSPAAGVLSGVTAGLLPPIAGAAERATLGALGTRLVEGPLADAAGNVMGAVSKYFPTVTQDLLAKAGGQAAAAGVMTASDLGQQKLAGQPLDVHPVDLLLNMTLGAAPFGLLHLGGRAFKSTKPEVNADVLQHSVDSSAQRVELRQVKEKLDAQSAVENLPKVTPTEDDLPAIQEAQAILAKSRGQQVEIKNNPDLSPEDKVKALSTLADDEAGATPLVPTNGTTVLGDQPDLSDRTQVVGTEIQDRAASRIIHVADFPVNPPDLRGKVVIYSKGTKEPAPVVRSDGTTVFGVSAPQWRTVKGTLEEWNARGPRTPADPNQPELPPQVRVMSDEELHDHMAELAKVNTEVDNAQTTADTAQAVVRLNHVEDANGLTLTTDSDLKKNVEGVETPEPVKAAIKAQTSKVARKIEALKQRQQDIMTGNEFRVQQEQLPEAADEVGKLHEIETQLASSRSSYADALVGGELNRMYRAWVQGGRVGGIEAFRAQVGRTANKGYGLFRNADITQAVREGAGPIGNLVDEQAAVVTHSPAGLSAYESWPSKDKPSFSQESGMFQTLVKEFGSIGDVDVGDAAQFLSDKSEGKMTVAEAKDEVKDFLTRPHVKVWQEQLDERLTQLRQGNAYPVPDRPAFTLTGTRAELPFQPYEPRTQPEADLMQRIGTTGHSAAEFLRGSDDPLYSAIGKIAQDFQHSLGRTEVRFGETRSGASELRTTPNGSQITIDPSSFDFVDRTIAHELVHALTSMELRQPTNEHLVQQFEDFRQSLIEQLPQEQRERVKSLIANDWLNRRLRGEDNVDELAPNGDMKEMQLIYGMLDTHEMVAQGLVDRGFQEFLKSKQAGKQTFFGKFAGTIKNFLGLGDSVANTKFEEFLSLTDQLMQTGNFASSFRDFAQRHFENQGMDQSDVNAKTQQALNVIGGVGQERLSPLQLLAKLNVHTPMYDDDPATTNYYKMLTTAQSSDEFAVTKSVMDEMGYKMGLTAAQQFARDLVHSGGGANFDSALLMLPDVTSKFVYSKIKSMQDILGVIKSATDKSNEGLVNLSNPSVFRGALSDIEGRIEKVLDIRRDLDLGQQHIQEMSAIAPDGFVRANLNPPQKGDVEKVKAFSKDSITAPKKGLAYWLQPIAQLVRQDPRAAQLASKGFMLEPNARQFAANSLRVMGIDLKANDGVLSDNSVKAAIKTISTLKTQKAVDRWMAENNIQAKNEERGVTLLQTENPEVAKVLDKLTPEEREGVIDTVTKSGIMTQATHQQILGHIEQISNTDGGIIAMLDSQTTKPEVAVEMAGRVFAALNVDHTDPQATQVADAQLKVVQERMSAPGFLKLLQFMQGEQGKYSAWRDYFVQNPYWATAQRQEKLLVDFNRGGKKYQLQASSEKEAKVIAEGGTNLVISDNLKGKNDEMPQLGPDTPALISRLKELQATQDAVMKPLMTPDAFEKRQQFDPVTQLSRELAATGGAPQFNAPPRLLSQGAEELPWLWNHISWVQRQSNYWTRQLFRAQSRLYLSSPELTDAPDLQKRLQTHVDAMLQPDPTLIQKVNHFTSTWFMGFAPASALINGMQTLSTLVPELTNISDRPVESYGLWRKSVSEVVGHLAKGGGKVWKDPEIDDLMRSGEKSGQVGFSMWDEAAQAHETISTNYKRAMMKNKPQDTWQRLGSIGGAWSTAAMWMFKNVEMFNQRVALVASYRQARDMGLGVEDAQKQAFEVNLAVNYGGGRAGRSTGLYSGKDQFSRGAAMLATNMQNYNLGVVSQLSRYLQNGLFRPDGLKPSQVHAARLAATQMLGTQLAAAGLLGLPFVSGAVAVLNQAFPGLEVNRRLRETMDSVLGSDKENGSVLSDAALTGLPSMLGWDMQSRLSWGNITPGVSEFNGFQPALMLGPPVNLVTNFVNGALKVAQGDPVGGEAFIPPGLKKLTQLVNSGGAVKDYRDRPLFNPTVGEQAGIALGFQPKRLSDFNAADRMRQLTDQNSRNRESQFNQQQAEDIVRGNFGTVRQQLQSRIKETKAYDVVSAVRSIAQNAEDLTFPRDLRREGTQRTGADRSRLLSSFNLPAVAAVSEVDRLKFRQQVEQRLGLAQPQDRAAFSHADLMDQLRRSNPDALRSELSSEADRVLHGRRRTASLLPELQ